jgi:hypothetical protein
MSASYISVYMKNRIYFRDRALFMADTVLQKLPLWWILSSDERTGRWQIDFFSFSGANFTGESRRRSRKGKRDFLVYSPLRSHLLGVFLILKRREHWESFYAFLENATTFNRVLNPEGLFRPWPSILRPDIYLPKAKNYCFLQSFILIFVLCLD